MKHSIIMLALLFVAVARMEAQEKEQENTKENTKENVQENAALKEEEKQSKFDFRVGAGVYNFTGIVLENELNYKLTRYFTTSISFAYSEDKWSTSYSSSYKCAGNIFISPFKNNKSDDFRIGVGIIAGQSTYPSSIYMVSNQDGTYRYYNELDSKFDYGASVAIEYTTDLSKKIILGFKGYADYLKYWGVSYGACVKLGMRL